MQLKGHHVITPFFFLKMAFPGAKCNRSRNRGYTQPSSTFQQYSINQGTELWRQKLEDDTKDQKENFKPRTVQLRGHTM